ncbi:hypothetical protein JCM8547_009059 [Rhodosporidiobolus lusitaniae]
MPRSPSPARSMSRSLSRSRSPPASDTIRIGKLTKNVTAIHIEEIFDVYGKITDIDLPIIKRLGTHKGTAWVTFASPAAAAKAASYMHDGQIDVSAGRPRPVDLPATARVARLEAIVALSKGEELEVVTENAVVVLQPGHLARMIARGPVNPGGE